MTFVWPTSTKCAWTNAITTEPGCRSACCVSLFGRFKLQQSAHQKPANVIIMGTAVWFSQLQDVKRHDDGQNKQGLREQEQYWSSCSERCHLSHDAVSVIFIGQKPSCIVVRFTQQVSLTIAFRLSSFSHNQYSRNENTHAQKLTAFCNENLQ